MNATIANLILTRMAGLPWMEKTAGLTRAVTFAAKGGGKAQTLPIACTVTDPQRCTVDKAYDILPDEKYRSVLFFEGSTLPEKIKRPGMGHAYKSRLRLIVWLDCSKLGGSCNCGQLAYQNIVSRVENKIRYNSGDVLGIRHTVTGGSTIGTDIFRRYTLDEKRSQYLHVPFDVFAVDIETDFRLVPGCEVELQPEEVACWFIP